MSRDYELDEAPREWRELLATLERIADALEEVNRQLRRRL